MAYLSLNEKQNKQVNKIHVKAIGVPATEGRQSMEGEETSLSRLPSVFPSFIQGPGHSCEAGHLML